MRLRSVGKLGVCFGAASLALAAPPAAAQLPDAKTLLGEVGLTPDQVSQVMSGQIVRGAITAASDRELVAALAFKVDRSPAELVAEMKAGLGNQVDPETLAWSLIPGSGSAADFAKLTLEPGTAVRAQAYLNAQPGGDLQLSAAEIASFRALAKTSPSNAAVEAAVRNALLVRVQAYQQKGLEGIAPYALPGGKQRSPADELRTATDASKALKKFVPQAVQMLNAYPDSKPPGTQETFRWTHFMAHGTPTVALVHHAFVPEGDAWVVVQRMFYVSGGFNAEQALAALVPTQGGTVVVYGNRTSTDQITGFGGGAKRSIGSKLLESQLEGLFQKARTTKAP
jgi:hypothetical protein